MLFQNILVPVDLSNQSTKAFKVALDIAKKYNSKVTILTCIEVYSWHHMYYEVRSNPQLIKKQKKVMKKHFEKLEFLAEKNNISLKSKISTSESVANDIVTFAKSRKHDLVVIGSHGRTGFDKWLLGSVANGVSQKTKCPVLIVK
ncbi:MAG: universal stress protein [Thaumarchaeota archaeon]|nr:universal stress protein [Nitrososphaerota archaeon]